MSNTIAGSAAAEKLAARAAAKIPKRAVIINFMVVLFQRWVDIIRTKNQAPSA
jgi:hypothetical protein